MFLSIHYAWAMYSPLLGPRPRSDVHALTDYAEVLECRRILYPTVRGADPDWLSEIEVFGTADEQALARDIELWGERPFEFED